MRNLLHFTYFSFFKHKELKRILFLMREKGKENHRKFCGYLFIVKSLFTFDYNGGNYKH
jgi:hypothetical protein